MTELPINRGLLISMAAFAMLAGPAFAAENNCKSPAAPTVPDGAKAEARDLVQAASQVKDFMKASDDYQACLITYIGALTDEAKADKKSVDPKMKASLEASGDTNQKEKERVGKAYNDAVGAFRKAHPK